MPTRKEATISAAATRVNIIIATIANHRQQSPLPTLQLLSNYAVDEIYIRETPSWMFVEDKVGNQELHFSSILFFFNKTCFRQETCLGDFAKIWMILRLKSLLETKCLKFRTPSFCPPRYQRALLCEFLEGLTNQRQKHAIYDNRVKSPLFNSLMSSLPPGR